MSEAVRNPECMDVPAWRKFTNREMIGHLEKIKDLSQRKYGAPVFKSRLVVRRHLCQ